nr:hypothetical protein [Ardenticatenales bacterium]
NLGVTSDSEGLSFDSWEKAVQAHVGHLLALALRDDECNDVQRALVHMNPNHSKIIERGKVKQVKELNGQLLETALKVEQAK